MTIPTSSVAASFALLTLLVASPLAAAEQHTLYDYNGWKVDLVVRADSSLACVATTRNDREEFFAVRVDSLAHVSVHVLFRNSQRGMRPLDVTIHGVMTWELAEFQSYFFGGSYTFWRDEVGQSFLDDLKKGRALSVSASESNQIIARFLIEGSSAALASLAECASLIRGAGV